MFTKSSSLSLFQQHTEMVEEFEYQISLLNEEKQSLADQIKKLQRCVLREDGVMALHSTLCGHRC